MLRKFLLFFVFFNFILSKNCVNEDIGKVYSLCKEGFKNRIYFFNLNSLLFLGKCLRSIRDYATSTSIKYFM